MSNADIRRQLGCGPSGRYDLTQQTSRIVKQETKPKLNFRLHLGVWFVEEGDNWRLPTADELKEFVGDVAL